MAIENRFASEEYVLNQIENNNDNIVLDWFENDSNSNNYIKNRTHYPTETVVFSWDGDESNHEVYEEKYDDNNYIKYIRVSNTVDDSIKEIISNGVCKYSTKGITYASDNKKNTTVSDDRFLYRVYYNLVDVNAFQQNNTYTAEFIAISFLEGEPRGSGSNFSLRHARAIFVLQEGFVGAYTGHATLTLPVGVYLTKVCNYGQVYTTNEYSYTKTKKLNESYLTDQGLTQYSKDSGNNLILQSYSTAEGYNNIIQQQNNDPVILLSLDKSGNNIEYTRLATHVEGRDNSIFGPYNHGEGQENKLFSTASHIEGYSNIGGLSSSSGLPDFTGIISGKGNHIEGYNNLCGDCDGAHVEGYYSNVQADYGHGEGAQTTVTGTAGHAQNFNTQATGNYSTASGQSSIANGTASDAGNIGTEAKHGGSFTRGYHTTSGTQNQAIVGQYNEIFTDSFFDVGNGSSSDNRKTAFSVKKDGSARLQLQGATNDSITRKDYVDEKIEKTVDETAKNILSITSKIDSWETVQKIVRMGYAPYVFKVGDQLACNHERYGELVWDIIGFDQDTPADSQYTRSMTLQLHTVLDTVGRNFDAPEAYYRTTEELSAGKYYLITQARLDGSGSNTYYQFTIPSGTTIPANAILYGAPSNCSFVSNDLSETYWTGSLTSKGTTVPTDGTILGMMNYYRSSGNNGGSNNWNESCIRFFLNGENETLDWVAQHDLDIPPPYSNEPGFLYQIDPEFKKAIGLVSKENYNHLTGEVEISNDLVFLPSKSEMYGGSIWNINGETLNLGEPYQYYINNSGLSEPGTAADECRIKYGTNGTAYAYYLRNPYIISSGSATTTSNITKLCAVTTSGNISGGNAAGINAGVRYLVPCCCIV